MLSPPFWVGLGGGARGALDVAPSLPSSLSGCLMEGTLVSDIEVSTGEVCDDEYECDLPSLVSLDSVASFEVATGAFSKCNATMTTEHAVADWRCACRRQRCAGEARGVNWREWLNAAVTTTYLRCCCWRRGLCSWRAMMFCCDRPFELEVNGC